MPENAGDAGFVGHFHPISITHAHARTHALYTARVNGGKQTHKTHITRSVSAKFPPFAGRSNSLAAVAAKGKCGRPTSSAARPALRRQRSKVRILSGPPVFPFFCSWLGASGLIGRGRLGYRVAGFCQFRRKVRGHRERQYGIPPGLLVGEDVVPVRYLRAGGVPEIRL
jgi:hypothetical protein